MTAEEFLIKLNEKEGNIDKLYYDSYVRKAMIEFAKYHVQEALKAASEVDIDDDLDYESGQISYYQNSQGILDAYPLDKIK